MNGLAALDFLNIYNESQNNKPLSGYNYYWINRYGNLIGGQTKFVDFYGDDTNKKIRTLRLVNPYESIKRCERIYGNKPIVINEEIDVLIFKIMGGGEAIVRTDICAEYLKEYLDDFIRENTDNI